MNERYDIFNIRQRGIGNPNPVKLGKCFQFLNDWYGFEKGGNHGNQYTVPKEKIFTLPKTSNEPTIQSDLATAYGITKQTMNNYMRLAKAIPELENLVDTGIVTTHTALGYETKDEVMQWMLDIQLGRRNLSPIQRIAVAAKYRSLYEKQARENLKQASGGDRRSEKFKQNQGLPNLVKVENRIDTTKKLAQVAGVGKETYRMGAKGLNSDNQKLKNEVLSGEKTISKAYKELHNENKKVAVEYVKLCGYKNGKILFVMNKNMFDVEGINIIFCG